MNDSEYITNMETSEEYLSEDPIESDSSSVTEIIDTVPDSVSSVSEVFETSEMYGTTVSDVDNLAVIANNTSGILLATSCIFFAIVIAFIAKIFGGYLSM